MGIPHRCLGNPRLCTTCFEAGKCVHTSSHSASQEFRVSSATPTPRTAPKATSMSTLPPPQSVPEKQKPARDSEGGGRAPDTAEPHRSEVRAVPGTTHLKSPGPYCAHPQHWPGKGGVHAPPGVCLHSQETDPVPGSLPTYPQPPAMEALQKGSKDFLLFVSEPPTRLALDPKPQEPQGN